MAITQTYLSAAITATAGTMTVNSGTNFPAVGGAPVSPGYLTRIDKEYMLSIQQPVSGQITIIQRGYNGTVAAAHDVLAKVEVSSAASDFNPVGSGTTTDLPAYLPVYQTLGQDTTFTSTQVAGWGNQPQNFALAKATAIAITLVAPSKAQDGLVITFTSLSAVADAITATSLLANGGTASPYTTATKSDTKIGGALTLQAQNGLWNVVSNVGWTIS